MFFQLRSRLDEWLQSVVPGYARRRQCPRTVAEAAAHFVDEHLTLGSWAVIASLPRPDVRTPDTMAHRRRIASLFGLTSATVSSTGRRGKGWNRALLRDCGTSDPEAASEVVFAAVWELLAGRVAVNPAAPSFRERINLPSGKDAA